MYNDKMSSAENLLEKNGSVFIQNRSFQVLATEKSKINRNISSSIMKSMFVSRTEHPCNLRIIPQFFAPLVSAIFHGTDSISFVGPNICSLLPETFKNIDSLENFKISIKKWKPENFSCKAYMKNVGFLRIRISVLFSRITF